MSKKENKITEEELKEIQTNQSDLQQRLTNIGFLEVQKANDLGLISKFQKEMDDLKKKLEDKYGAVNINVKTGEYTEITEEEKTELKKAE
jgi:hypothetical protein